MPAPVGATAEPVWGLRSAGSFQAFSAAKSSCTAEWAKAAPSPSICPRLTSGLRGLRSNLRRPATPSRAANCGALPQAEEALPRPDRRPGASRAPGRGPADRGGRSALRADCDGPGARHRGQGSIGRRGALKRSHSRGNSGRRRSRSTSSFPTCWDGRC